MLRKLFKYEFKATSRIYFPLLIAYCIVIVMLKLFEKILIHFEAPITFIFVGLLTVVFGLLSSAIYFFPLVSSIVRFNKNVLGDEGYLTNTLPINSHHIIISKLVISIVWYAISGFSLLLTQIIYEAENMKFDSFLDVIKYIIPLPDYFYNNPLLIVLLIITVVVFISAFILMFYSSICVGQLSNSYRWLKSIVIFIAFAFATLFVLALILPGFEKPLDRVTWNETQFTYFVLWLTLFFSTLFGGIFYFITQRILTRRLNIQ